MTTHTVNMTNNCGFGVPTLDQIPSITLATGSQSYTNGTVQAGAFLNTGYCGPNGGNCTTVDIAMNNTISIVVVDLIPTHVYTVPVLFTFFNGCDGAGVSCLSSTCVNAIRDPSQTSGIVTCSQPGAGVLVTFCPNPVVTPASTLSITSSSSTSSPAVNPASNSTTSNNAAVIGGVVGGVVGGLVILSACVICFFRFRRRRTEQVEEYAINEFRVPAPPSASLPDHGRIGAWIPSKRKPSTSQLVQPSSITPIDSGTHSLTSQHSAGVNTLPLPHQAPNSTAPASVSVAPTSDNLDRIIESLAERFGWTAPPPSVDGSSPAGHHSIAPPEYS
ncbi:hypothetical protein OG21DRAFT_1493313 [Imleria badia]|nr:hypothetical protein OG21DRAFT_1493313 [Imleria badia]